MSTWEGLTPPYSTIVVDPPWHYDTVNPPNPGLAGHIGTPVGATALPYSSMTVQDIQALPVGALAAVDARVFLWVTNRYLRDAWAVVANWGFTVAGRVFVWCKAPMGTANVTTEFFLIGRRGTPPPLPWHNSTWFNWKRQHHAHSVKPAEFYDLVEAWSPGPYVELFARQPRLGWDHWGYGVEAQHAS
ncbi:MAG TPA: MT-A70 family methyltransferase [Acidimicrobiales bacterium]|nr:MT-A70 family methyltransferase [Acidimicrobiales bacterium]